VKVAEKNRLKYVLDLSDGSINSWPRHKKGALVRGDISLDLETMAALMISAYEGTVDYDGESLKDAVTEVQSYLEVGELQPLLECSWLFFLNGTLASACLVSQRAGGQMPLIAYITTGGEWKNHGLAKIVLAASLECLGDTGISQVTAFITDGNGPSERLAEKTQLGGFGFIADNGPQFVIVEPIQETGYI
jgi:hypothetical protein